MATCDYYQTLPVLFIPGLSFSATADLATYSPFICEETKFDPRKPVAHGSLRPKPRSVSKDSPSEVTDTNNQSTLAVKSIHHQQSLPCIETKSPKSERPGIERQPSSRSRKIPALPKGEHNIAARCRIISQVDRNRSRNFHRREPSNPTQTMRSSRRRNSLPSNTEPPKLMSEEDMKKAKKYNRRSAPPKIQYNPTDPRQKHKENPKASAPLPTIPASPEYPIFRNPWVEKDYNITNKTPSRRHIQLDDAPSPRTKFQKPTLLTQSQNQSKTTPTIALDTTPIRRSRRDISYVPMSASKHHWGLFIDGKAPYMLQCLTVLRRPSADWPLDTPGPELEVVSVWSSAEKQRLGSSGWDVTLKGTRRFDGDGYWRTG